MGTMDHIRTENSYLLKLRRNVEQEIQNYVYEHPVGMIGSPMTNTAISQGLAKMRECLVDPYWVEVEIRDTFEEASMSAGLSRKCAVVAEDGNGMLVLFDPTQNSFVLAERGEKGLTTFGVGGDAVGCFFSR